MRLAIILWLCGWSFLTAAIAPAELVELELEDLQESWWRDLLSPLYSIPSPRFLFRNRISIPEMNDPDQCTWHSGFSASYPRLSLYANFRSTAASPAPIYNLAAHYRNPSGSIRQVIFGDYGITFGHGICSQGYGFQIARSPAYDLTAPTDPNRYQPTGLALTAVLDSIHIIAYASMRQRAVTLSGDRISHLYRNKTGNTHNTTNETLSGLLMSFPMGRANIGLLCHYQDYDRSFADTLTTTPSLVLSAFASFRAGNITSSGEVAFLPKVLPALKILWIWDAEPIRQKISIASYPESTAPAYAGRIFLLRQGAARQELQYMLNVGVSPRATLSFSTVHNHSSHPSDRPRWLDRQVLSGDWKDKNTHFRLSLIRFDKHLIAVASQPALTDDLLRLRLNAERRISKSWQSQLSCVWNLETRGNLRRNGILIENRHQFRHYKHRWILGCKTWHTHNAIYDYIAEDNPALPYEQYSRENVNLFISYAYNAKYADLSLRVGHDLYQNRRTALYAGLSLSF